MRKFSRRILIGALSLVFLNSACGALTGTTPAPIGTILPDGQIQTVPPTTTSIAVTSITSTSITPLIPITGANVVSMQCQFCVDMIAHAVLIFPDFAFFDVVTSAPVTCLTAQVVNGQRVLICRGAELTSFTLNICSDRSNCLQFPVALDACPLLPTGTGTPLVTLTPVPPFFLTPINTLIPPTSTPPLQPTRTMVPSLPPTQATVIPPPATSTIVPPSPTTPQPPTETTEPPPPTAEPTEPPAEPTSTVDTGHPDNKKPSKTPKP